MSTTLCNNATIYANSSKFVSNLNRLMDELVSKTSETGFNISSYGQSPNKADTNAYYYLWNVNNVTSNPQAFMNTTRSLLYSLTIKATNPANKGFAADSTVDSAFHNIYALVQCWRDISIDECNRCLSIARENIYIYSAGKQGARVLFGSCVVRYEIYPFFKSIAPSPSPPGETGRSLLCTQADPALRPPMSNVIFMISENSETLANPTKPAYFPIFSSGQESQKDGTSRTSGSATLSPSHGPLIPCSINDVSISDLYPR
eukprot:Gb_25548 [translate_table: standard]